MKYSRKNIWTSIQTILGCLKGYDIFLGCKSILWYSVLDMCHSREGASFRLCEWERETT